MKIVHVITGLNTGGAEMMLYKLLSVFERKGISSMVLSLRRGGPMARRIESLGIPVLFLDVGINGFRTARSVFRAVKRLRQFRAEAIQGWMYHGNLAAIPISLLQFRRVPVLWNVRHSLESYRDEKLSTAAAIWLGARFSGFPKVVLFNSEVSAHQHQLKGFRARKQWILPNGFDVARFRPDPFAKSRFRNAVGILPDQICFGLVARYHPMKDHWNFLQAAARLVSKGYTARFVLAGKGVEESNGSLGKQVQKLGIADKVLMLGERTDLPDLMAGLDVLVLSSAFGEGFPNVLGEAMASGVPCVATEVGDAAAIVGDAGFIVRPRDPEALAAAMEKLIQGGESYRAFLGENGRKRILEAFDLYVVAERYAEVYAEVIDANTGSRGNHGL